MKRKTRALAVQKKRKPLRLKKAKVKPALAVSKSPSRDLPIMTLNQHFEFGFDGQPFNLRTSPEQTWWVNYGRCSRDPFDWRGECLIAARQISQVAKGNAYLCFSGGIDSQVMLESFRYARMPFRVAILRFKKDLNVHDISWAVLFCEEHNLPYEIFELDAEEFYLGGELMQIATESQCITPMLPTSMKLMEMIAKRGGFPVLGSAECFLEKGPNGWVMYEREKIAALYRFQMKRKIEAQCGFFQWSPEIMLSFLLDPMVRSLVMNKLPQFNSTYYLKPAIYRQYFNLQPRTKYTGFEKIMHLDKKFREILGEKFKAHNQEVKIPYVELVESLKFAPTEQSQPKIELAAQV